MQKPISNLSELLTQAKALQSDQKLQALLDPYPVPKYWSAYTVLFCYKKQHQLYQDARSPDGKKLWRQAIERLEPLVKAIANYLEDSVN